LNIFTIKKVLGYSIDLEVRVYSSGQSLKVGIERAGWKFVPGTKAQFSPYYVEHDKITEDKAILFLCENWLTMKVISHESTHIAFWICKIHKLGLKFGKDVDSKEEKFAYILGEVGRLLVLNLRDLDYYKE